MYQFFRDFNNALKYAAGMVAAVFALFGGATGLVMLMWGILYVATTIAGDSALVFVFIMFVELVVVVAMGIAANKAFTRWWFNRCRNK